MHFFALIFQMMSVLFSGHPKLPAPGLLPGVWAFGDAPLQRGAGGPSPGPQQPRHQEEGQRGGGAGSGKPEGINIFFSLLHIISFGV